MSRQHRRTIGVSIFNMLVALFSFVAMLTSSVNTATPSTVNKLTIAMDSWGSDMIDPWEYPQGSIIQSYLNLHLVTRDRHHWIVPLYDAGVVYGYSDRVSQHAMPQFGAHFLDLNRILLKD